MNNRRVTNIIKLRSQKTGKTTKWLVQYGEEDSQVEVPKTKEELEDRQRTRDFQEEGIDLLLENLSNPTGLLFNNPDIHRKIYKSGINSDPIKMENNHEEDARLEATRIRLRTSHSPADNSIEALRQFLIKERAANGVNGTGKSQNHPRKFKIPKKPQMIESQRLVQDEQDAASANELGSNNLQFEFNELNSDQSYILSNAAKFELELLRDPPEFENENPENYLIPVKKKPRGQNFVPIESFNMELSGGETGLNGLELIPRMLGGDQPGESDMQKEVLLNDLYVRDETNNMMLFDMEYGRQLFQGIEPSLMSIPMNDFPFEYPLPTLQHREPQM